MRVCVDRRLIGTKRHLLIDSECQSSSFWTDVIPESSWWLSGRIKEIQHCLDTVFRLEHVEFPVVIPKKYIEVAYTVIGQNYGTVDIPWHDFMSSDDHRAFIKNSAANILRSIDGLDTEYSSCHWRNIGRVLTRLRPSNIDTAALTGHLLCETSDSQISILRSFTPTMGTMIDPPVYDRFGTKTGRLTVESGPQILTVKKSHRNIVRSVYDDGRVISIDLASAEARVLYLETHESLETDDIYTFVNEQFFKSRLPRDVVKSAVLCEIFGMGSKGLSEKLGCSLSNAEKFMSRINDLFKTDDLRGRLRHQFVDEGFIRNRFGRKIKVSDLGVIVNNYVQSTAVDVALYGFVDLIERLETLSLDIRPLMVIHDDLLIDCPGRLIERVCKEIKEVFVPLYETNTFPVKVTVNERFEDVE